MRQDCHSAMAHGPSSRATFFSSGPRLQVLPWDWDFPSLHQPAPGPGRKAATRKETILRRASRTGILLLYLDASNFPRVRHLSSFSASSVFLAPLDSRLQLYHCHQPDSQPVSLFIQAHHTRLIPLRIPPLSHPSPPFPPSKQLKSAEYCCTGLLDLYGIDVASFPTLRYCSAISGLEIATSSLCLTNNRVHCNPTSWSLDIAIQDHTWVHYTP